MVKKITFVGTLLIMLFLLVSCDNERYNENIYNAVILDSFSANLKEEFFEMTFDVKDEPKGLDEWWSNDTDGWWNYGINGKTLIHKQALVIKEQSEADIAFDNFPSNFDFEKEMLILCFFAESSQWIDPPSAYTIKDMKIQDSALNFTIEIKARTSSAQGRSNQRFKIIRMNKFDILEVFFSITVKP
jgi:hypothetical protein